MKEMPTFLSSNFFLLSSVALVLVSHAEAWSRCTGQKQEVLWTHIYEHCRSHCSLCVSLGSNPGLSLAALWLTQVLKNTDTSSFVITGFVQAESEGSSPSPATSKHPAAGSQQTAGQCCRVRAVCLMQIGFIWSPGGDGLMARKAHFHLGRPRQRRNKYSR